MRFFAFFKVFLLHLPIHSFTWFSFLKKGGGYGVDFFFVLSSFLISYLAIVEKNKVNKFALGAFFKRRILRIWPLFYFAILIAFFTPYFLDYFNISYSMQGYEPNWWMSISFLENYKMAMEGMRPNVSPLAVMWSLCIEEHFYVIWGLVFLLIKVKRVNVFAWISVVVGIAVKLVYASSGIVLGDVFSYLDTFGAGTLIAYYFYYKRDWFEHVVGAITLFKKWCYLILLLLIVILFPHLPQNNLFSTLDNTVMAMVFSGILILMLPQKSNFKIKDSHLLTKLGRVSYGLYIYHTVVIMALFRIFAYNELDLTDGVVASLFVAFTLLISIAVSLLSYRFIEKPFLRLKYRIK